MNNWRRHNGGDPRPSNPGGQRIQWRVIGSNRAKYTRIGQMDWRLTFEWRFAA